MILSPPILLLVMMTIFIAVAETSSSSSQSMSTREARNIRGGMRQLSDLYGGGGDSYSDSSGYGETSSYDNGGYGGGGSYGDSSYGGGGGGSYGDPSYGGGGGGDSNGDSNYGGGGYGGDSSFGGGSGGDSYDSYGGGGGGYGDSSGYGDYSSGYGDSSGYGNGSEGYQPPSKFSKFMAKVNVKVPLIPVLIIAGCLVYMAMVFTAFMYQIRPESTFTNCCRCSINAAKILYIVFYNLVRCRLGEIPPIVCAIDDDDEFSDEELERMKPRPKLEDALNVEHKKAMDKAKGGKGSVSSSRAKLPKFSKKPSPESNNDRPMGSISSSGFSKLPTFGKTSSESKPSLFKAKLFG